MNLTLLLSKLQAASTSYFKCCFVFLFGCLFVFGGGGDRSSCQVNNCLLTLFPWEKRACAHVQSYFSFLTNVVEVVCGFLGSKC